MSDVPSPDIGRAEIPPPPPPLPSAVVQDDEEEEASSSAGASNGHAKVVKTISGKLSLAPPPPKPAPESIWHDKDMDFVDKVFIVVFPLTFLLFNCAFWPILVNYDKIF